ncbi:hypothetical protein Bca4012_009337 [Brassica carinata]
MKELKEAVIETAYGGLGGAFFGGIGGMVIGPLTRRNPRSIYSLSRTQIGLSIRWWLALSFVTHGLKVRPAHALSYAAVYAVLSRAIYKSSDQLVKLHYLRRSQICLKQIDLRSIIEPCWIEFWVAITCHGGHDPRLLALRCNDHTIPAKSHTSTTNATSPADRESRTQSTKHSPGDRNSHENFVSGGGLTLVTTLQLGLSIRWWVDILFCEPRLQSKPAHALSWAAWYAFASGTIDLKEVDIPSGARLLIIDHIKSEWTVQELIESLHTHELRHNDYILPARSHTSTAKAASPADRESRTQSTKDNSGDRNCHDRISCFFFSLKM